MFLFCSTDLSRLLVAQLKEIRAKLNEFCNQFTEWAKDLPIISTIKEKVSFFPLKQLKRSSYRKYLISCQ